jgi:hypothetical protein
MSNVKRRPGRPPGSKNKVNIRNDIQRALRTGKSLTEIKDFIEDQMLAAAEIKDIKNVAAMTKHLVDLIKYLHKTEMDFENSDGEDDDDEDNKPKGDGVVTPLSFKRKE